MDDECFVKRQPWRFKVKKSHERKKEGRRNPNHMAHMKGEEEEDAE